MCVRCVDKATGGGRPVSGRACSTFWSYFTITRVAGTMCYNTVMRRAFFSNFGLYQCVVVGTSTNCRAPYHFGFSGSTSIMAQMYSLCHTVHEYFLSKCVSSLLTRRHGCMSGMLECHVHPPRPPTTSRPICARGAAMCCALCVRARAMLPRTITSLVYQPFCPRASACCDAFACFCSVGVLCL